MHPDLTDPDRPCSCSFFTREHTLADHGLADTPTLEDVGRALRALDLLAFSRWVGRMRRADMEREARAVQRLRDVAIRRCRE